MMSFAIIKIQCFSLLHLRGAFVKCPVETSRQIFRIVVFSDRVRPTMSFELSKLDAFLLCYILVKWLNLKKTSWESSYHEAELSPMMSFILIESECYSLYPLQKVECFSSLLHLPNFFVKYPIVNLKKTSWESGGRSKSYDVVCTYQSWTFFFFFISSGCLPKCQVETWRQCLESSPHGTKKDLWN